MTESRKLGLREKDKVVSRPILVICRRLVRRVVRYPWLSLADFRYEPFDEVVDALGAAGGGRDCD